METGLSRFDHARQHAPRLAATAAALAAVGLALAVAVALARPLIAGSVAPSIPAELAAALLAAAGGFAAASLVARARQAGSARLGGWPAALASGLGGALAVALAADGWVLPAGSPDPGHALAAAGLLVLGAFPLLVLERHHAGLHPESLPEAAGLGWLLRVPLAACLLLAAASALAALGYPLAMLGARAAALLAGLTGAELLLRALATLFLPAPPLAGLRAPESSVARLIRLRPPGMRAMSQAVERQFGIDLSRSWALGFVGRALPAVVFAMVLLAWGITGVTALPMEQRAIYERFGAPRAVLGPGLHLGLPWPFGIMRRVENGVLHDQPVALAAGADPALAPRSLPSAEAPAPPTADRLWNQSHASEATYLVASEARGQQSFQAVDADIRLIWRVGLTNEAAMAAAYHLADPARLIRAVAGQLMARYFAGHTLMGVLGEDRAGFIAEFRAALQGELDRLGSGIDVVAVIVEAIHPPPAAAGAYHNVQAAEINARVSVADEAGAAAQRRASAGKDAARDTAEATALAAETVALAEADASRFRADRDAHALGPRPFLLERWLDRVRTALGRSQLMVLDHRLAAADAVTVDLRAFAPPPAATP